LRRKVLSKDFSDCTDKGKPAARQGRKAVNLRAGFFGLFEIVWLPKAIGKKVVEIFAM
jgi:hypothetical protein